MRALTRETFERLDLKAGGMEFASEMIIKAALLNANIVEVPTSLFPDRRDRPPHLRPFRDGWRHLRFMLLFAPTWFFLIPGTISFLVGSALLTLLVFTNPQIFGLFSIFYAQGMILLGAHAVFLGMTARRFSRINRLAPLVKPIDRFLRRLTIEHGLAVGGILALAGAVGCAWVGVRLLEYVSQPSNLGLFNMRLTKIGVAFTTLIILGLQLIFSSFYAGLFSIELSRDDMDSPSGEKRIPGNGETPV
ncbi:MAG: hypothetical protein JRK53_23730 [Deltaproteobacteria bacterium]|nr:hypothetical protein [Deltaproteobacteria bacterium]